MKRVAWMTDVHLNVLSASAAQVFLASVARERADALLVGGDVAESPELVPALRRIAETADCPVYFVLGNHDYYFSSIERVRSAAARLCAETPGLIYLSEVGSIELTQSVGLVGHDGWADGRLGDYERSLVMMNDYRLIDDFQGHDKQSRWGVMQGLAAEAAAHVRRVLPEALERFPHVLFLTHVPPFLEACWHEGRISDEQWSPHFTSKTVGDALVDVARAHPDRQVTVLCGHTHGEGESRILPNLRVLTGGAEYGAPRMQRVFEFA